MPKITLEHITKRWGKFYGVDDLNLVIGDNSFVTLLGPSGCGKTTILRMIAGLETPTEGKITIGDKVVFDSAMGINIPPNKRKVGFLFQNYALWPNMTVYDNISFGLYNIKDNMAKVDYEAKNARALAEILKNPDEVKKILEDCRDKNGKIDEKKAYIKFIDAFTISIYTAKKLYGYHLEEAKDMQSEITALEAKAENSIKSNGLNENFEFVKDGKVVTELRKLSKEEVDLAVRRVSRIVKIGMFMDRYPAELSGGQQQRVAIARTLAPEPSVLFMDEPLSNLDAKLRLEMRYELQRLHVETGSTFVYVTHDQMEAMTLATEICLVNNGVLQQYAAPLTVYNKPENLFVGDFVGNPSINFCEAEGKQNEKGEIEISLFNGRKAVFTPNEELSLDEWFKERDSLKAQAEEEHKKKTAMKNFVEKTNKDEPFAYHIAKVNEEDYTLREEPVITNENFVLGIRPEFISISENGAIDAEIYGAMPTGMESTMKLRVDDFLLTSVIFGSALYKIGSKVKLDVMGNNIILFDRKSGKRIAIGSLKF